MEGLEGGERFNPGLLWVTRDRGVDHGVRIKTLELTLKGCGVEMREWLESFFRRPQGRRTPTERRLETAKNQ